MLLRAIARLRRASGNARRPRPEGSLTGPTGNDAGRPRSAPRQEEELIIENDECLADAVKHRGSVVVRGCVVMPDTWVVHGDLTVVACPELDALGAAGQRLEVGGTLTVRGCPKLATLGRGLCVRGQIFLEDLGELWQLEDGLEVEGDVSIVRCPKVQKLPLSLLEVRHRIVLHETGITDQELIRMYDLAHMALQFVLEESEAEPFPSLDEAVAFWAALASQDPIDASSPPPAPAPALAQQQQHQLARDIAACMDVAYAEGLLQFLSKLRRSREFQAEKLRPGLAARIMEALRMVVHDAGAREELLARIADSTDACNDKPIWALNQLECLARISRARGNAAALRAVGAQVMRLQVVHDFARHKVAELHEEGGRVDDVCVYLRFEIALRETLDLPVSSQAMLFPAYIQVSKLELDAAARAARAADLEAWLPTWEEWQRQARAEFAAAVEWRALPEAAPGAPECGPGDTDLVGDALRDPVLLGDGRVLYSLADLLRRFVETGQDLHNRRWSSEAFGRALSRARFAGA